MVNNNRQGWNFSATSKLRRDSLYQNMLPVPGVIFSHGAAVVHSDVDPTLREHLKSLLLSDGDVLSDTVLRGEDV